MRKYDPLKITGMSAGLVQEREEFLLPDDAYPVLQNAYVWREKLLRKKGFELLGRLQRNLTGLALGNTGGGGNIPRNLIVVFSLEPTTQIVPGTVIAVVGGITYTDNGLGVLVSSGIGAGTINYATGNISITGSTPLTAVTVSFSYYPGLPVMGIRIRELQNSANDQTVFFDQKYAYIFNATTDQFQEFIPGTTWNAAASPISAVDFFWSTNYWVSDLTNFGTAGTKLLWVTNNTGANGNPDPIRITDGSTWLNFQPPTYGQIDASEFLVGCLAFLPFRGRLVAFNTFEGVSLLGARNFSNRIRWSTIGNPFIPFAVGPPSTGSWRDDIRGQGGFLDIPTSEDIVSVGFVRDNLVIYCERSTWQLRYTGRSIAPFQIERVNSELGVEGTFSSVQFDTSLVGIGDKGVVECDSYKSERIDIKIPDLVFKFSGVNNAVARVHGIRDFSNRLAYWTFPLESAYDPQIPDSSQIFCNERLVYNYDNDSWAIFNDSLTTLGTYQEITTNLKWLQIKKPWKKLKFPWIDQAEASIITVAGNQQGFIEILDKLIVNDVSLFIQNIIGDAGLTNPVQIISPNHNMSTGFVINIEGILSPDPFFQLNFGVYAITVIDQNTFTLSGYDSDTDSFSVPIVFNSGTYLGDGLISIRENFTIQSKKFNFLDEGQNIQLGYIDVLINSTSNIPIKNGVITSVDLLGTSTPVPTVRIVSKAHGLIDGAFVFINNVVGTTQLNENIYTVSVTPKQVNSFNLMGTNALSGYSAYVSGGTWSTVGGAMSLNVYIDYNDSQATNTVPMNDISDVSGPAIPDTFFNSVIPTTQGQNNNVGGTKFWNRVYCATRASFITLQYTFSNRQMAGFEQTTDVQIDAQILWLRKAGRMNPN